MVDKIFTNFFSYLVIGILTVFFIIFILSFLKDLFLEWELESSLTKIYSHMHDIIMIIRENDSEVPLVVYCKNNNLDVQDIYKVLNVSNFIEAKELLSNSFLGKFLRWAKRTDNVITISNEFKKILSKKISNKKLRELALVEQIYLDMIDKIKENTEIKENQNNQNNESKESKENKQEQEFGGQDENKF
jgi:hypothetical protein